MKHLYPQERPYQFLLLILVIAFIGSLGFYFLGDEKWSLFDSFYMTVITLSTVGFTEVHQLNTATRLWAIFVIVFGVSGSALIISKFIQEMIEFKVYRRRRMERRIAKMDNHYIVCGFGRMGEVICEELVKKKQDFVVIEQREMNKEILAQRGFAYITGDATSEQVLIDAGLEKAHGIAVVLGSDPDNLFVTMSVKTLNPDIFILARCSTIGSNTKFKRAGANRVVNPYVTGGQKMAELLIEPVLDNTVQITAETHKGELLELGIDQIQLAIAPYLDGKTLGESRLREDFSLMVLVVIEESGQIQINPLSTFVLKTGQKVMLAGAKEDLDRFRDHISN